MPSPAVTLNCDRLEPRLVPTTAAVAGGVLTVSGTPGDDRIRIVRDGDALRVFDGTAEVGAFSSAAVASITVAAGDGDDLVLVSDAVVQPVELQGGAGDDRLYAGGGDAILDGGPGDDRLTAGQGATTFNGGPGANDLIGVRPTDTLFPNVDDRVLATSPPPPPAPAPLLTESDVTALLQRAAAASASSDAIIAVVDRGGRILGVRVETGVAPEITADADTLAFAVDGAVALARTGAFFANNQAPLTSRTIQFISQSTVTEREVNSNPNDTDPNSTVRGPGFVAPVGVGGHFPPGIANTPQVDLFQIEHSNRDASYAPGADGIRGTADDVLLAERFNLNAAFVPAGKQLTPPDGYGAVSGTATVVNGVPVSQNRGIATLPGGIPLYKDNVLVGGIGVFFPGKTGYATEMNSELSTTFDPTQPDRSKEAEWIAFAAAGGTRVAIPADGFPLAPVGDLGGVPLPAGFGLPTGRIDLVGITLDVFGAGGPRRGQDAVLAIGNAVGRGDANDGTNLPVTPGGITVQAGQAVPDGWLVLPHDGDGITQAEVEQIITQAIAQGNQTRAAIRLPLGSRASFVYAVADRKGEIVGLFSDPDATVFSIDVAVAKARNVAYYANADELQPADRIDGLPAGVAFTSRTFRYVGEPRFPEGIDGATPGPFSQLLDGGADPLTGRQVGPPLPASAYQSVIGFDSFNPTTNFRDPTDTLNANGIVFFPGSAPVYKRLADGSPFLAGGFGVSGDGVDQDDVVTVGGQIGFDVPDELLRADEVFVRGVRLPYQKFNRNPEG